MHIAPLKVNDKPLGNLAQLEFLVLSSSLRLCFGVLSLRLALPALVVFQISQVITVVAFADELEQPAVTVSSPVLVHPTEHHLFVHLSGNKHTD